MGTGHYCLLSGQRTALTCLGPASRLTELSHDLAAPSWVLDSGGPPVPALAFVSGSARPPCTGPWGRDFWGGHGPPQPHPGQDAAGGPRAEVGQLSHGDAKVLRLADSAVRVRSAGPASPGGFATDTFWAEGAAPAAGSGVTGWRQHVASCPRLCTCCWGRQDLASHLFWKRLNL